MVRFATTISRQLSSIGGSARVADESHAAVAPAKAYGLASLAMAACTLITLALKPYALLEDEEMLYVLVVLVLALRFDVKVSLFAAALAILAIDFFLIPPIYRFAFDARRILTFLAIVVIAFVVGALRERLRIAERRARRTAAQGEALDDLKVELSGAAHSRQLAAVAARYLERLFDESPLVLLRTSAGQLEEPTFHLTEVEAEAMHQAWVRREPVTAAEATGYGTWVPLLGSHERLGVIGVKVGGPFELGSDERRLLTMCARELSAALDRLQLASSAHRAQVDAETERMRSSLLGAVSHDLKTPLANIVAAASAVRAHRDELEENAIDELLSSVVGEGERLTRLVQNLLSTTRLDSPTIELRRTPEDMGRLVASALERLGPQLQRREVEVALPPDLPRVLVEPAFIEQLLLNLLENAVRHTPSGTEIRVVGRLADGGVGIQIADRGPGIPEQELERVFDEFYRGSRARKNDGGVGLGLTICQAIVKAHGGTIALLGRQGGGLSVEFTLPAAPPGRRARARVDQEAT